MAPCCPSTRRKSSPQMHPRTSVIWPSSPSLVLLALLSPVYPTLQTYCRRTPSHSLLLPLSSVSIDAVPSARNPSSLAFAWFRVSLHGSTESSHPPGGLPGLPSHLPPIWLVGACLCSNQPSVFPPLYHNCEPVFLLVSLHRNCAFLLRDSRCHTGPGKQVTRMDSDLFPPDANVQL